MSHKGKTASELEQLRLAKSEECQKIFDAHKVDQDGKTTYDLTPEQLDDVRARMAEINAIGKARDEVMETEQIAASVKSIQDDLSKPIRPNFGGNPQGNAPVSQKGIGQQFVESKAYQEFLRNHATGQESDAVFIDMRLKTLLTTTTGWVPEAVRSTVVVPYATPQPAVTDLIPTIQITQNAFVYMEETTFTNAAVEVAEGAAKPEATLALTERTSPVRKIAVWIPVTDEQLEDVPGMQEYIENRLGFMVRQRLNTQILVGNGTPPNLLGILSVVGIQTQAKGVDPTPDAVYKAMTKVRVTGQAMPSAYVSHPNDWQDVKLLRTTDGIYIWGNPSEMGPDRIWGLPVVLDAGLTEGTGIVGDFQNYSLLAERKGLTIKVGYQNDDFIKNQRSIVAEIRAAFAVLRPAAFCSVTGI
jgi:HK97 family phage major capsid protein